MTSGTSKWAVDYILYHDAADRWLAGDGFYLARQLQGPYEVLHGDVLYPPTILVLLVPFAVLPAFLWWAIPIAIIAAVVVWHEPHPIAWALLAFCLWFPITGVKVIHGNPVLWMTAALAMGTVFGWPSVLVVLKPILAPFALVGAWSRRWWLALGGVVAISLLFLPMWGDYVRVLQNARTPAGPLYSINEVPMLAIPVIAWLGRARRRGRRPPSPATDAAADPASDPAPA
jgi:hypothetical protein